MEIKIHWKNDEGTRYLLTLRYNGVDYYGLCAVRKKDSDDWYLFEPNSEVGDRKYKYYRFSKDTRKEILDAFLAIKDNYKKGE